MPDQVVEASDSSGQSVVIVRDKVTHLVSAGGNHTEVHFVSGSYVRIVGSAKVIASMLWPDASPADQQPVGDKSTS